MSNDIEEAKAIVRQGRLNGSISQKLRVIYEKGNTLRKGDALTLLGGIKHEIRGLEKEMERQINDLRAFERSILEWERLVKADQYPTIGSNFMEFKNRRHITQYAARPLNDIHSSAGRILKIV